MRTEVKDFIQRCDVCQKNKSDLAAYLGLLQPLPIPEVVWSQISTYFIDGLPKSHGCVVILVVVDKLNKMIIKKVGPVAYTLLLPSSVKIHPTVHVSLLTKCYKVPSHASYPPIVDLANPNCLTPESVLQRRMVKKRNRVVAQVLVKWVGLPANVATWEFATILKTRFPSFDP
ncbi:hypothetical protein KY285_037695 [Solanum tuberosum]|nr:hypothetical protein KY285_037695 [Solanum tuberosum]